MMIAVTMSLKMSFDAAFAAGVFSLVIESLGVKNFFA